MRRCRPTARPFAAWLPTLAGLACLASCAEDAPAPPAPAPAGTSSAAPAAESPEAPTAEVGPAWPHVFPTGAHEPVVAEILARANLPKVPNTAASATQRAALDEAKNLTKRLSLRFQLDLGQSLARAYQENLFPERALEVLGLCLREDAEDPLTLKLLAGSLNAEGRFEDALRVLEQLTRTTPQDAGLAGPLFTAHFELGDLARAREALEVGRELAPFLAHLDLALGRVLMAEGDAATALEHLERAAENLPTTTEAWFRLAMCYDELERFDEAAAASAVHKRLDQMKEFGIELTQPEAERRRALVEALAASGDAGGAERERAALERDFPTPAD